MAYVLLTLKKLNQLAFSAGMVLGAEISSTWL